MSPFLNHILEEFLNYVNLKLDDDTFEEMKDDKVKTKQVVKNTLTEIEALREEQDIQITENDFTQIDEFFKTRLTGLFKESDNPEALRHEFINRFFMGKTTLTEQDQADYLEQVALFCKTQAVSDLYDFGHIIGKDNEDAFRGQLFEMVNAAETQHRGELLANIAVFIEHFNLSPVGNDFINNYTPETPHEWFRQLFDHMKNHSPLDIGIERDPKTNEFHVKMRGGGGFDGLYILPMINFNSALETQISATSSIGPNIERDSVARHMLSNALLSQAFDCYLEEQVEAGNYLAQVNNMTLDKINTQQLSDEEAFEKLHRFKMIQAKQLVLNDILKEGYSDSYEELAINRNVNLEQSLSKAIEQFIFEIPKEGDEPSPFKDNLRELTKEPLKYFKKWTTIPIEKEVDENDVTEFLKQFDKTIMRQKSVFATYHPTMSRNPNYADHSTIWPELFDNGSMAPEQFRSGLQLIGLIRFDFEATNKMKGFNEKATHRLYEGCVALRSFWDKGRKDDLEFDEQVLNNMEKLIVEHFVLKDADTIYNNQMALDKYGARQSIESYMKFFASVIENEQDYKEKMEKIGVDDPPEYLDVLENLSKTTFAGNLKISKDFNRLFDLAKKGEELEQKDEELEQKDVQQLNMALKYQDDSDAKVEKKLENIYENFKKKGYNGKTLKVTLENYREQKKYIDETSFEVSEETEELIKNYFSNNDVQNTPKKGNSSSFKRK